MSVYLYTPPTWRNIAQLEGPLHVGIATSTCVYRKGGVWTNVLTPGSDVFDTPFDVWVDSGNPANTLNLFFTKPMVIPGDLHDELAALTPADPSWVPGSLTLL
jgi:hypothetical protein